MILTKSIQWHIFRILQVFFKKNSNVIEISLDTQQNAQKNLPITREVSFKKLNHFYSLERNLLNNLKTSK